MTHEDLRSGDVIRYTPLRDFMPWHCREGMAVVDERGCAVDTFWGSMGDAHVLTAAELDTATHVANLDDYILHTAYRRHVEGAVGDFEDYRPEDRLAVTHQHRLQAELYVRKGSSPDLATKILNARAAVEEAESELRSAERKVGWKRDRLAELEAQRDESGTMVSEGEGS